MPLSAELRDLLALHLAPGLGPVRTAALLEHFGSAAGARQASAAQLLAVPGIGPQLAGALEQALRDADVDRGIELMERFGVRILPVGGPEYPACLAPVPAAPRMLYMRGTLTPADERAVALVGSRRCTAYGKRVAEQLAAGLVRAGVTVVSGLARGIDGISHRAALAGGGRTLAVLAGGLSRIYPPEHKGLAEEVVRAGALITESSMAQEPLPGLFPARNRIISGLCRAIVIVEAPEKSGALITAEHAAEQGRPVLAVPGPIDAETSAGCNELIRTGATLCRGVQDILEEIDGVLGQPPLEEPVAKVRREPAAPPAPTGPPPGLDEGQRRIWDFLVGGPRNIDEMTQQLGLSVSVLSGMLMMLEMKKVVRRLPGSRYERC